MEEKAINSHVQAPRLLLKRFQNASGRFFYYDVKGQFIGSNGHSRTMNTRENYYPESIEKILNQLIETPFAALLSEVEQIDVESTFHLSPGTTELVRSFMMASLARNPGCHRAICEGSDYAELYSERDQHGLAMIAAYESAEELYNFKDFFLTITVNKSKIPLVFPINCLYQFNIGDISCWNLVIGPERAITMVENKGVDLLAKGKMINMFLISDEKQAYRINDFAFREQCAMKEGWVISPQREVLEELMIRNKDIISKGDDEPCAD